ncbi:hypothetical protein QFZ75_007718 [Streptomyces sp. V3I8]|nr:hypothetical protein [Streptomyces sp. V3I8]
MRWGCGGRRDSDDGPGGLRRRRHRSPGASGRPAGTTDGTVVSKSLVRTDIRAAVLAGRFEGTKFSSRPFTGRSTECHLLTVVHTDGAPDMRHLRAAVAELKDRRRKQTGNAGDETGEGWLFEKGRWELDLLAAAVTGNEPNPDTLFPERKALVPGAEDRALQRRDGERHEAQMRRVSQAARAVRAIGDAYRPGPSTTRGATPPSSARLRPTTRRTSASATRLCRSPSTSSPVSGCATTAPSTPRARRGPRCTAPSAS